MTSIAGLTDARMNLPDQCRCGFTVARVAKANVNGHRYRLVCIECNNFRGYVGIDLEQHLVGVLQRQGKVPPQPIILGKRKTKMPDFIIEGRGVENAES